MNELISDVSRNWVPIASLALREISDLPRPGGWSDATWNGFVEKLATKMPDIASERDIVAFMDDFYASVERETTDARRGVAGMPDIVEPPEMEDDENEYFDSKETFDND